MIMMQKTRTADPDTAIDAPLYLQSLQGGLRFRRRKRCYKYSLHLEPQLHQPTARKGAAGTIDIEAPEIPLEEMKRQSGIEICGAKRACAICPGSGAVRVVPTGEA